MSVVVGVLVALAVVALAGPGARARAVGTSGVPPRRAGTPNPASGHPAAPAPPGGRRRRRHPGRGPRRSDAVGAAAGEDLAGILHAVAAQVRAGVPPGAAWSAVLGTPVDGHAPPVEVLAAAVGTRDGRRARVRAVVAGAHVAAQTGAPLAQVLEQLAEAVAADAEQAGELTAALAGPRATARVLTALPALGVLVGGAMGARPWQVLTDGGLGSALAVTGIGLVVTGRVWVGALVRRAAAP